MGCIGFTNPRDVVCALFEGRCNGIEEGIGAEKERENVVCGTWFWRGASLYLAVLK
eukprot:TRINITY_DN10021_c0_g1_i1.p5 TRINITY_DN10021_c0_g1~~TRINITY_DN10021_c0_g1_i1.p5  ORF type:complete len:56 (-),score=9.83 TRINITY_DN10021_c0_g1_i1:280-447(-)